MELGNILEFRKDLYFEGAVQADWFYTPEKASKVAENFVFHGNQYYGVEVPGVSSKRRIDTVSLVEELFNKLNDEHSNALSLAIADYGTGKSHLAVTLAQLFSGSNYMPETFNKVIDNIKGIDSDAADRIKAVSGGRNFVMVINGMRDFNLHAEILKSAKRSLRLYGLPEDSLRKLNRAIETAEIFFERNANSSIELFEKAAANKGWLQTGQSLVNRIRDSIMTDDEAFDIVNDVYKEINGQEIHWDEGLSASSILEMLVSEYCGMNGIFDHIIILFDEFGRYLEYTAGVNAAKSGESGLQQIFELTQKTQNVEGYLHVINFIQRDIKAYLETVDQTKNVSRYIGRFDQSEKYYISSNLETVFANLIQRKDKTAFNNIIVKWQYGNEAKWREIFNKLNKWLNPKGMWSDYTLFRKVAVEGIYPMHPISTFMLTNLSDYLQNRSSLTLISNYIEESKNVDIEGNPLLIMPERLMDGDLYIEMLSAEQEGRQKTQQCIKYDNVLRKFADKLSDKSLKVLRANLVVRVLRFKPSDLEDSICAISLCSGLTIDEIKEELKWLEDEYAVLEYDDHAHVFDFAEESNGAHDFKVLKKRLLASATVDKAILATPKILELAGVLEAQTTNFGIQHKISTTEWQYTQEMYPIEDFVESKAVGYIESWKSATSSTTAKGKLVWLYANRDTNPSCIDNVKRLTNMFDGMPIVIMLLNDSNNRMYDALVEYHVLDNMDDLTRKKYERHFQEDYERAENNLKDEIDTLRKQRMHFENNDIVAVKLRMPQYLTNVFESIYFKDVTFYFDAFVTKGNNIGNKAAGYYCSFLKMLLSNSVSEATIHNYVVDMRNRVEALFSTNVSTSWKCINDKCKLIPPEEENAKFVYDEIVGTINDKKEISCKDIYDRYCKPPYGMSEDVVTLMIAVVCSNLSYCLRIRHGSLKNINVWKDEVVTNKDKKVDLKAVKESVIVFVDAGAVTGKYMRFFDKIKNNTSIMEVNQLSSELKKMVSVDEVPEELEQAYLLAQKTLDSGIKARHEWDQAIGDVNEKFEAALDEGTPYNALVALKLLRELPYERIFKDNGYIMDEQSKSTVKNYDSDITAFLNQIMGSYIATMYCDKVEKINTFRNHNTKIETMLSELGFNNYAEAVRKQKEAELGNVEEIKSRQELRADYDKYMEESKIDKYTSFVNISSFQKRGVKLQERVAKYKNALGKDSEKFAKELDKRVNELTKARDRIKKDMTDIWDDLYEVKIYDDVEELLERIALVLQKGIPSADQESFTELQGSLQGIVNDIKGIKSIKDSRKAFSDASNNIKSKYENTEFDFDVMPIIEGVVDDMVANFNQKEEKWKKENLYLGDKSRKNVHKWKEKTQYLPEYLTDDTLKQVQILSKEADTIISEGKIEDVVFYFEKLDSGERRECISKLNNLI